MINQRREPPKFVYVGERVSHPRFGRGTVSCFDGDFADVAFDDDNAGNRRVLAENLIVRTGVRASWRVSVVGLDAGDLDGFKRHVLERFPAVSMTIVTFPRRIAGGADASN